MGATKMPLLQKWIRVFVDDYDITKGNSALSLDRGFIMYWFWTKYYWQIMFLNVVISIFSPKKIAFPVVIMLQTSEKTEEFEIFPTSQYF